MSRVRGQRGVVFDLDGTLVDSMSLVLEGLATAVAPYRPRPSSEEVMATLGGPSDACVRRLLGSRKHCAAALAAYLDFLRRHEDRIRPFRGARRLLADLSGAEVRLGIWTGRERTSTLVRLEALALRGSFDVLVCGDDLPTHKPDPAGLLKIIRRWRLPREAVVFVGDSDQDLAGGVAAGVAVVTISHGRRIAPALAAQAFAVAATPAAAYTWVRKLVLAGQWD
jgi:HAD superfamily hydrolase (TIGR01509 family)